MAITVKLGKTPKNFLKKVTFQMLDPDSGATVEGKIGWTFKYRTRTEFGEMLDNLVTEAQGQRPKVEDDEELFKLSKQLTKTSEANANYIMKIADGWDMPEEFSHANVMQLANEVPSAINAAMDIYAAAIRDGRLGN